MLAAASSLAPRNRRWRLSRRLVVERVRGVGDGESHAMRLCTSDVTPVITRPGLETGRCQMVATVAADTISPALLYNSRASPIRRGFDICNLHTSSAAPLRRGACGVSSARRSLYNSYRPRDQCGRARRAPCGCLSGCLARTSLLGPWSGRSGTDKTDTQPSASSPPTRRRLTTTPSAHVTTPKALTTTPFARAPSTDRRASSHAARGSSRPF
jgi:hypothetical protein